MENNKKSNPRTASSQSTKKQKPTARSGGKRPEQGVWQPKSHTPRSFDLRERRTENDPELHAAASEQETGIHGDYENGAVIGRNAVRELLRAERPIDKLLVQRGERTGSIVVLVAQAIEAGIPVIEVEKSKLDQIAGFAPHQGVIALAAEKEYCTPEDILQIARDRGESPLIVICDGITDPYNLGAIIRCAECCGAHGIIIPKRRAAGLTPLVTKASAGAVEHLAIAKVANIASTVEQLKKQGVWTFAAEAGGQSLYTTDLKGPCAIILGSEGNGVSQLVQKTCDAVISIPMYGKVNSFNVSTAAAVILAEAARQHHQSK